MNKIAIKISIILNIIFLSATLFIGYLFYSNIKLKIFPKEIITTQEAKLKNKNSTTVYYEASKFKIIGQLPNTESYNRLPLNSKNKVRKPVWNLSKNSAGISIRFSSNSSTIKIRWKLKHNNTPSNMTPIAAKGLDLYTYNDNKWQFVGAAKPTDTFNETTIIQDMDTIMNREYLLNLPLYNGVDLLEIGINKNASIRKPAQKIINTTHPIIFYGTSITQGASASRPGLTYAALLERHFNKEVINLGFSGHGRFEKEIAKYIMTAKPSIIVLDCTPNSSSNVIRNNIPETIEYINSINNTIPIVLIESIIRDTAFFKKDNKNIFGTISFINEQNKALKDIYKKTRETKKNIFYINNKNLIGQDHEATIDGTHFNDLRHYRTYKTLKQKIEEILPQQENNLIQ